MSTILSYIKDLLEKKEQLCTLMEATDEVPYERLLVALQSLNPEESDLLEITATTQHFEGTTEPYYLIQFQYVLPIEISVATFNQVASSLHFFNRLLHCPGFELDEVNNQIDFRYAWFVKKEGIDAFLLMQVVGNVQLCYKIFSSLIKDIAEGKYTLEEVLEQVIALANRKTE